MIGAGHVSAEMRTLLHREGFRPDGAPDNLARPVIPQG